MAAAKPVRDIRQPVLVECARREHEHGDGDRRAATITGMQSSPRRPAPRARAVDDQPGDGQHADDVVKSGAAWGSASPGCAVRADANQTAGIAPFARDTRPLGCRVGGQREEAIASWRRAFSRLFAFGGRRGPL